MERPTHLPDGTKIPLVKSEWQHSSGELYKVSAIANIETTDHKKYPITVFYHGKFNNKLWCRPVSDWYRSMTLIKEWEFTTINKFTPM
jgi:hypothetical protein